MGKLIPTLLSGEVWTCSCGTHLAYNKMVLSTDFHCASGDAYLFAAVVNVLRGKNKKERLRSGMYIIADLFCVCCYQKLGWIYDYATADDQKYKEEKVVLERSLINLHNPDASRS